MLELQLESLATLIATCVSQCLEGILEDGEVFVSIKEGLEESSAASQTPTPWRCG